MHSEDIVENEHTRISSGGTTFQHKDIIWFLCSLQSDLLNKFTAHICLNTRYTNLEVGYWIASASFGALHI